MKTLLANMRHAVYTRETTHIGGGEFSPDEMAAAIDEIDQLLMALRNLQRELHSNRKLSIKKDYSLMVADAQATKAIAKAEGEI